MTTEPLFVWGNVCEFVLWTFIGLFCLWRVRTTAQQAANDLRLAGVVFLVFGLSDLVEVTTGAWWRPLGLLFWKAACVGMLMWLAVRHYRSNRV